MIDFSIVSSTPFKNPTAFRDLCGLLAINLQDIAEVVERTTAAVDQEAIAIYPLGDGTPGDRNWLFALQQQLNALCRGLLIEQPTDLSDFNLRDESEFYSFTFLLGNELERIKIAAGL
jgi:hypothetical protein